VSAPSAVPERPTPTAEQEREAEDLYRRGLAALSAQRPDDALRYWELAWSIDPRHAGVCTALEREYLMRGMEAFAAGRLDDATALWQKVLRLDPAEPRALAYLARARMQRDRTRELIGKE